MAIKNYTSQIPAARSISHIEAKLTQSGARQILKLYDDEGRCNGMCFIIKVDGKEMPFKLPARVAECEKILMGETTSRTRTETIKKIPQQAERTAWKILLDWVEAQMAMIHLSQVEFVQVFLSYHYNPATQQTYYEMLKEKNFRALLPAGEVNDGK